MDRIKKALDKARAEREAGGRPAAQSATPVEARPEQADGIRYTKTRVVETRSSVLKSNRVITGIGPGPVADAYRILRTKVLQRMRQNEWNALAVTSPGMGEGKTLTAVNLAISIAMEVNHTVLLVDLDLRRPMVASCFGYRPDKGISDYILSGTSVQEVMFNPSIERLVVLPGHKSFINSSEMLSAPQVVKLVEELKSRYPERLIIFDLPPVLSTDDALAFAPYVDAVLLVVEEGKTQSDALQRAADALHDTPILGSVLNKAEQASVAEYYS